ncbi:MFS transporter [Novosphingobium guangzhouense]|uniref:MFS transporter n=1 Tax=Novosphingobium guangzhouense TaxID=1850347 RepID=A0A2K2G5W8_9SPHN|nr:MFS transporter [Novosphingobium guangzhouense]PNU06430.1 MFS transporter [Novosphingobium guangzhouense]
MTTHTGSKALALLVAGTFFMENLDATVVTPAVPAMAKSFAAAPVDLSAGVSAYMIALGVFIPVSGWAAQRFGARQIFAAAIVMFTLTSLLCGMAQDLPQFVAARVLQGIGGAMMVPVGRLVVLRETPKERLVSAIAVLTWPALVAPVLGPPLGGLIVDHGDWRWIFWLNLPLGAMALAGALRLVPHLEAEPQRRFDWTGFLLLGGAIFALMLMAEDMSRPDASLPVAATGVIVGLVLLGLGVRHLNRAETPMLRLSALETQTFAVTIWGGSLFRMGVSAVPFLVPIMFQVGFGYTSFQAGGMLMAVFAGNLTMKPFTTAGMRRFGMKPVLLVNGTLNAAMIAACALFGAWLPLWATCAILFLGGMTRSMQFTVFNTIAFADVPKDQMTDANTLFSTAFQLAMGMGITLGAIAWRLGEVLGHGGDPAAPFRIAFLIVAAASALGIIDSLKLAPDAGRIVAGPKASLTNSPQPPKGEPK